MSAKTSTYPLRLPVSVKTEAERLAAEDGTSLNQFVASAVAEKLAALRTATFFTGRSGRGDREAFRALLRREGGEPPHPGDELPARREAMPLHFDVDPAGSEASSVEYRNWLREYGAQGFVLELAPKGGCLHKASCPSISGERNNCRKWGKYVALTVEEARRGDSLHPRQDRVPRPACRRCNPEG
ncbi:MAG TPA: hypothetical protein VKS60_16920 [Stellaceae bacterium]|nr:hypothetical protein [Stellaceae bacterium]